VEHYIEESMKKMNVDVIDLIQFMMNINLVS
jgi:hypothetical protein